MEGTPEEMQGLRSNHVQGVCTARYMVCLHQVLHVKSMINMLKQHLFSTPISSLLDQPMFLKLPTLFCTHVSLESATEQRGSAVPEQSGPLTTPSWGCCRLLAQFLRAEGVPAAASSNTDAHPLHGQLCVLGAV